MKTAKQIEREARQCFRLCLVEGRLDENRARIVVQRIVESRQRGYLQLLGRFQRLIRNEYARRSAEIQSALPLSSELKNSVQTGLTSVYGPGLSWLFTENPALIGGVRLKVGSDVYDGSVRSALMALARSFGISAENGRNARA